MSLTSAAYSVADHFKKIALCFAAAGGKAQWQALVQAFWEPLEALVSSAGQEERVDVVAALDKLMEPIMFPAQVLNFCRQWAAIG